MNAEFAKTLRRRLYPLYESLIQSVKGFFLYAMGT